MLLIYFIFFIFLKSNVEFFPFYRRSVSVLRFFFPKNFSKNGRGRGRIFGMLVPTNLPAIDEAIEDNKCPLIRHFYTYNNGRWYVNILLASAQNWLWQLTSDHQTDEIFHVAYSTSLVPVHNKCARAVHVRQTI